MNREDFELLSETIRNESDVFLEDTDRVSFIVRNENQVGSVDYFGTDCIVCLAKYILKGHELGLIKHKGDEK